MIVKSEKFKTKFFAHHPSKLGGMVNTKLQHVEFYEHPEYGDEVPVFGVIDGVLFNTEFFDLDDMAQGLEYEPVLVGNDIKCRFELL